MEKDSSLNHVKITVRVCQGVDLLPAVGLLVFSNELASLQLAVIVAVAVQSKLHSIMFEKCFLKKIIAGKCDDVNRN